MLHHKILEKFKSLFPMYVNRIREWFPHGKGSIRVRFIDTVEELVFNYTDDKTWSLETLNAFCKRLEEKRK